MIVLADDVQVGDRVIGRTDQPPYVAGPLVVARISNYMRRGRRLGPRFYFEDRGIACLDVASGTTLHIERTASDPDHR